MSRITTAPTVEASPAAAQPLLNSVKAMLGSVPNFFRMVANSPAALEGYLSLTLTNYINVVAQTDIDFPVAPTRLAA